MDKQEASRQETAGKPLSNRQIVRTWWPLAASWLLMALEGPAISAVMARLANPEINLAAYGGVVFPLSLIIEAPIIMLLAASTALSVDRASYRLIYRFMMISGAALTALHILVAFTPLYDFVASSLLGVPPETVEPARIGLMLMTPWTWAIAYRRFQQGVLIRYGQSQAVGVGTFVRLSTLASVLLLGYVFGRLPGIVVGTLAQAVAVTAEALFAGWRVRPILRYQLPDSSKETPLTWRSFFDFYIPLALTSLLTFFWNPIGSAAISRMPDPLQSLAVWPVVSGLVFILRSSGAAYNEVVVALLDRPRSFQKLQRFTWVMSALTTAAHLIITATPLAFFWFSYVTALNPELVALARVAFWLALPMPLVSVFVSWYQGALLFGKRTRPVPESVIVFLVAVLIILGFGIAYRQFVGLYVGMTAFSLASIAQAGWLWLRSRPVRQSLSQRDSALASFQPSEIR